MNVYMNFILQLHRLENEFKEDDAINDVKKAVYNAVENFFPYADNKFKRCALSRVMQGIIYNKQREELRKCINNYSKLEFGGAVCE